MPIPTMSYDLLPVMARILGAGQKTLSPCHHFSYVPLCLLNSEFWDLHFCLVSAFLWHLSMLWILCWYVALTTVYYHYQLWLWLWLCLYCVEAICLKIVVLFEQILGNHTEFQRVTNLLQDAVDLDIDVNASVFETNIRGKRLFWNGIEQN